MPTGRPLRTETDVGVRLAQGGPSGCYSCLSLCPSGTPWRSHAHGRDDEDVACGELLDKRAGHPSGKRVCSGAHTECQVPALKGDVYSTASHSSRRINLETIKILCETSSRPAGTESFQHRGGIQLVWVKSAADQQAGDGSQAGRPGLALRCLGPPRAPTAAQPGPRQGHCGPRPRWRLVRAAVPCGRPSRAGLASGSVTAGSGFLEACPPGGVVLRRWHYRFSKTPATPSRPRAVWGQTRTPASSRSREVNTAGSLRSQCGRWSTEGRPSSLPPRWGRPGTPPRRLDEELSSLPDLPGKYPWNPLGKWPRYLCGRTFLPLANVGHGPAGRHLEGPWTETASEEGRASVWKSAPPHSASWAAVSFSVAAPRRADAGRRSALPELEAPGCAGQPEQMMASGG
ncbi:uncharacterized protein LOC102901851 [Felis catus]|uniref:uncharacterized protein LOC102901851 n=1 Tax=Felis catus TaxID=9685 RepID=UPI001D19F187|nr:uncharacterized protein LOC102901851 [Felis catus]